ncbi:PAS domain-containing protein [Agrobacterium larrymoorei]|uniref:PAS domain S-box protein n=1 Tax=Agrobacterium larrymoorei TaxID=160699 RepID=A0A4D7DN68_9HYPH|nr:PAS domain-containing protein [Agrobacterium larrymoorei]QCI97084.1 PAS domain S-box protein [Agrobacterium larrymoorei]QYA07484.1 PAS domain-containing protein [Agrobacterium larrymoorei]WHA41763.1 PAS domain-containing protein [Agrobacterium larrymoorei]
MDCPDGRAIRETGYYTWDILENLVCLDKVCAAIFEFSEMEGAEGLPIEAFIEKIAPSDREKIAKAIHDCLLDGTLYHEEYPLVLQSGAMRWVRVDGRMVYDEQGDPVRGIGSMMDVTVERLLTSGLTRQ